MEKVLQEILKKLEKLDALEERLDSLEQGQNELKAIVNRIEKKQNSIFEQTAGLLEFRTETLASLEEIKENNESLMDMYGEHEVQIRNLKKRTV